jgi:hypothetical protein
LKAIIAAMLLVLSVPQVMAATATLPVGASVRLRASGLGDGWLDGKVARSAAGCVMVNLAKAAPGGYTSVSLGGVSHLQLREGAAWRDIDVKPIHAGEPADCQGDND